MIGAHLRVKRDGKWENMEVEHLIEAITAGELDDCELDTVSRVLRQFVGICKADDNEDSGTPTDKPTIKERMDCAKNKMQGPGQTCEEFYYWTGYFTALVEICNGDIFRR